KNKLFPASCARAVMLLLLCGGPFGLLRAQSVSNVGTTAASFLKIGVGARALAMGEAYTTLAEDASGVFWNPGGAANLEKTQAQYFHQSYLADIAYDFGAVSLPLSGFGTVSAFLGNMNFGEIERTSVQYQDGTGEKASANSFVCGLSYARALTDRFSIGGNIKYVHEGIWHSSADGYAFDIGLLYKTFFKNIRIGMSISNFGSRMKMEGRDMQVQHDIDATVAGNNPNINAHLDTDEFPMPILFRVGLSANVAKDILEISGTDWIIAVDAVHPSDNNEFINAGTELALFNRLIALRGGFRQYLLADREGGPTFGAGVQLESGGNQLGVDFAAISYGRFGYKNVLTLIVSF
ncbi:MAG: PorV/PorQ family protein, partial [Ignavibacteriae bacterium]